MSKTGKPLKRESINSLVVARGWLEELIGEGLLNGYWRFPFWGDEKALELDSGGCTAL